MYVLQDVISAAQGRLPLGIVNDRHEVPPFRGLEARNRVRGEWVICLENSEMLSV